MDIKQELLKIMQKHNVNIEYIAKITDIPYNKLKKSFDKNKIRYYDAAKILDTLGYKFVFKKII